MNIRELAIAAALGGALVACGPQTPPTLATDDNGAVGLTATGPGPLVIHEAAGRSLGVVRPEPRPEGR